MPPATARPPCEAANSRASRRISRASIPTSVATCWGAGSSRSRPRADRKSTRLNSSHLVISYAVFCLKKNTAATAAAQTHDYPKEIRGYKVERAVVEVKRSDSKERRSTGDQSQTAQQNSPNANEPTDNQTGSDPDALIQLGKAQLARVTPLGVTFEVPLVVAPVKRSGHVDFLLFEAMVVNGTSVDIDEYRRAFDLPNKQ